LQLDLPSGGFLDQVYYILNYFGTALLCAYPVLTVRFRKLFPETTSKVRPFVSPLQPYIAYFAIVIAITILSTLFWGYKYNLIFALYSMESHTSTSATGTGVIPQKITGLRWDGHYLRAQQEV